MQTHLHLLQKQMFFCKTVNTPSSTEQCPVNISFNWRIKLTFNPSTLYPPIYSPPPKTALLSRCEAPPSSIKSNLPFLLLNFGKLNTTKIHPIVQLMALHNYACIAFAFACAEFSHNKLKWRSACVLFSVRFLRTAQDTGQASCWVMKRLHWIIGKFVFCVAYIKKYLCRPRNLSLQNAEICAVDFGTGANLNRTA